MKTINKYMEERGYDLDSALIAVANKPQGCILKARSVNSCYKTGDRIYDVFANKYATITAVKETAPEWVSTFAIWDGDSTEVALPLLPNYVIVSSKSTEE